MNITTMSEKDVRDSALKGRCHYSLSSHTNRSYNECDSEPLRQVVAVLHQEFFRVVGGKKKSGFE